MSGALWVVSRCASGNTSGPTATRGHVSQRSLTHRFLGFRLGAQDESGFDGPWWCYPPLRNALAAGLIAGAGFVLAHLGLIAESAENVFYWLAIPLGGWHWTREEIEKLVEEREVGIEMLMIAATTGSGILELWDEAAALVFLYGAAAPCALIMSTPIAMSAGIGSAGRRGILIRWRAPQYHGVLFPAPAPAGGGA